MFKKIIVASAAFALFACSSSDDTAVSSASQGGSGNISSSSHVEIVKIPIASLNGDAKSEMFGNYAYVFALKEGIDEDLTPFWDVANGCSVEKQDSKPPSTCELDMTNAILQHNLTNQYSKLHYQTKYSRVNSLTRANALNKWNLTGNGDEATLGLNVSDDVPPKDMADVGITDLNNIAAFEYRYAGGAHEFRIVSKTDNDFWYYEVQASTTDELEIPIDESAYKTIIIPISELKGMGSYAANEEKEETPFDISKAAKFLWSVKYNAANATNNKGTLAIYDLKAQLKP